MIRAKATSSNHAEMVVAMAETESRLGRWSRLKSKGGADAREETQVREDKARTETALAEPEDPFRTLPGGARVRHFVPAMAPLAPEPEDEDDHLTRGTGHIEDEKLADEESEEDGDNPGVVMPAEPALADGESDDDLFAGIDETELSEEEQEIVSTLPPLESLGKESDFTPFLRDGVPEFLQRRALRVLWRVNPFFNFRDGLNEYDDDYNVIHKIIDSTFGSYKVGRGHLSEEELHDMMPEEARRAFDEPEEDEQEAADTLSEDDAEGTENSVKTTESPNSETVEYDDDTGDGEDDPNA
jgi:hypothetical protein